MAWCPGAARDLVARLRVLRLLRAVRGAHQGGDQRAPARAGGPRVGVRDPAAQRRRLARRDDRVPAPAGLVPSRPSGAGARPFAARAHAVDRALGRVHRRDRDHDDARLHVHRRLDRLHHAAHARRRADPRADHRRDRAPQGEVDVVGGARPEPLCAGRRRARRRLPHDAGHGDRRRALPARLLRAAPVHEPPRQERRRDRERPLFRRGADRRHAAPARRARDPRVRVRRGHGRRRVDSVHVGPARGVHELLRARPRGDRRGRGDRLPLAGHRDLRRPDPARQTREHVLRAGEPGVEHPRRGGRVGVPRARHVRAPAERLGARRRGARGRGDRRARRAGDPREEKVTRTEVRGTDCRAKPSGRGDTTAPRRLLFGSVRGTPYGFRSRRRPPSGR